MSEKVCGITSLETMFILLPTCVEHDTDDDVFLSIVKSTVGRSKLTKNVLEFKTGMSGKQIQVVPDDLLLNWKESTSENRKNQFKLLGFWAVTNYPSIGKKLFGGDWQAPERISVKIVGSEVMDEVAVDAIIFKKMQLRIVELNVCPSTCDKMKHFVRAPITVAKCNEETITRQIKTFDVQDEFIEDLWEVAKLGQLSSKTTLDEQMSVSTERLSSSVAARNVEIGPSNVSNNSDSLRKVAIDKTYNFLVPDQTLSGNVDGSKDIEVPAATNKRCSVLLSDCNVVYNGGAINNSIQSTKRSRLDIPTSRPNDNDTLRMTVIEMQKDIAKLTTWLDPTTKSANEKCCVEIAALKLQLNEAMKNAASDQSRNEELIRRSIEMSSENSDLKVKLDAAMTKAASDQSRTDQLLKQLTDISSANVDLKVQLDCARSNSVSDQSRMDEVMQNSREISSRNEELIRQSIEMSSENSDLKVKLDAAMTKAASDQSRTDQLLKQLTDISSANVDLKVQLDCARSNSVSDQSRMDEVMQNSREISSRNEELIRQSIEMSSENSDLKVKLDAAMTKAASDQSRTDQLLKQLTDISSANVDLKVQLDCARSNSVSDQSRMDEVMQNSREISSRNEELIRQSIEMSSENSDLKVELDAAMTKAASDQSRSDQLLKQLTDISSANVDLKFQLDCARSNSVSDQSRIQDIMKQLTDADLIRIELTATNKILDDRLSTANKKLEEDKNLRRDLHILKNRSNIMESQLKLEFENVEHKSKEMEMLNDELTNQNLILREELKTLKDRNEAITEQESVQRFENDLLKTSLSNLQLQLNTQIESVKESGAGQVDHCTEKKPMDNIYQSVTSEPSTGGMIRGTNDRTVEKARDKLLECRFGWIRFNEKKNTKWPGFVHPPDKDGTRKAQKVTLSGYVSNRFKFFEYFENISADEKEESQLLALSKFNQKFNFSFE